MSPFFTFFFLCFFAFLAAAPKVASAFSDPGPEDERASTFVAGKAEAAETFGYAEGAILLVAGAASILAVLVLWLAAAALGRRNSERLGELENSGPALVAGADHAPAETGRNSV